MGWSDKTNASRSEFAVGWKLGDLRFLLTVIFHAVSSMTIAEKHKTLFRDDENSAENHPESDHILKRMSIMVKYSTLEQHLLFELRERWTQSIELERWDDALALIDQELVNISQQQNSDFRRDVQLFLFYLKGNTYQRFEQWRLSVKWYIKTLRLDSEDASAWSSLGITLRQLGKPNWAANCLKKVNDPMSKVISRWSESIDLENFDDALAILDTALIKLPQHNDEQPKYLQPHLYVLKGITYGRRDQWRLAVKSCVQALRIDSENRSAWSQLGRILLKIRKANQSVGCFQRALTIEQSFQSSFQLGDQSGIVRAYFDLARARNALGDTAEAIYLLRKALEISPGDTKVTVMLRRIEESDEKASGY